MPSIKAIRPTNFEVLFAVPDLDGVDVMIEELQRRGYRPPEGEAFLRTSEGLPICPKHHEPMRLRQKQGDKWHSHRVVDTTSGQELFCRGYAGKVSPGWQVSSV